MITLSSNGEERVLIEDEFKVILTLLEADGSIDSSAIYEQLRGLVGAD